MAENSDYCIIEELTKKAFLQRSESEQNEIIENGRPTPSMPHLTKKYNNINRRFNSRHYDRYEWLAGSKKLNKLFCWYCLLFEDKRDLGKVKYHWATAGYSDMRQLVMAATRHAFSQNHHKNMIKYQKFRDNLNKNTTVSRQAVKKAGMRRCIINQILGLPFLERSMKEQLDIFTNGRPTPPMPSLFIYDLNTNRKMGFQSENYLKFQWLAGSQKLNRLYCWKCLLFADASLNELWISVGFNKMETFLKSAHEHETSKIHKELEDKYDDFERNYGNFAFVWTDNPVANVTVEIHTDDNQNDDFEQKAEIILPDNQSDELADHDIKQDVGDFYLANDDFDGDIMNEDSINLDQQMNLYNSDQDQNMDSASDAQSEQEQEHEEQEQKVNFIDYPEQSHDICIISQLLQTHFSKLTPDLQKQILTTGRPLPDTSSFSKLGNSYFNKFDWLTASLKTNKYYCWYCLLMKERFDATFWGEEGIPYARNVNRRMERHDSSTVHIKSMNRYNELIIRLGVYVTPLKLNITEEPSLAELLQKYKNDNDIVVQLLLKSFQDRSMEEQREIITNGRPKPKLPDLYGIYGGRKRYFRPIYYEKYEWLCGSNKLNKIFCWYCLLVGKSVWGREGVSNICKMTESFKKHNTSTTHNYCMAEYYKFGKTEEEFKKTHEKLNTQQMVSTMLSSSTRCIINELLGYPFSDRPLENRIEILRNGRPTPNSDSDGEHFIDNFCSINYFKYTWLAGSMKLKKLFCWSCLLFADAASTNVWVQTGFDRMRKLSTVANKHEKSKFHNRLVQKYNSFKKKYCDHDDVKVETCDSIKSELNIKEELDSQENE